MTWCLSASVRSVFPSCRQHNTRRPTIVSFKMSLNYSFTGKRVLITGGGQGIGRQLVQRFHDDGAKVFTIDKNPETIKKVKEELPNVTAEVVDLTDWEATKKVIESFGVIDHLVNNAGVCQLQTFFDITKEAANL